MMYSLDDTQPVYLEKKERPDAPAPELEPSTGDTISAAFRMVNTVGSVMAQEPRDDGIYDPDFDPYSDDNLEGYESFADSFIDVRNEEDMTIVKRQIDRENDDREILASSGGMGVTAMLAAGMLDPIFLPFMLFPPAAAARTTAVGGKTGLSVGKTIAKTAAYGGTGEAAAQLVLQGTQETITPEESMIAIGGATVLSGLLGGATTMRANSKIKSIEDAFIEPLERRLEADMGTSIGAAQADNFTINENTLVSFIGLKPTIGAVGKKVPALREWADRIVNNPLGVEKITPVLRLMNSPLNSTRNTMRKLADIPLLTKADEMGKSAGPSVESLVKMRHAVTATGIDNTIGLYRGYRKGGGKLKLNEFRSEVGNAMRKGDMHEIPEVQQAAQWYRKNVFDPLRDEAADLGLFDSLAKEQWARMSKLEKGEKTFDEFKFDFRTQVKSGGVNVGSQSYLRRVYRTNAIRDGRLNDQGQSFEEVVADWLMETTDDLERAEALSIAGGVSNKILGTPNGLVPTDIVPGSKALKARTLTISDERIATWLEDDIELIASDYTRTLAPEVELTKRFGDRDLSAVISEINDEAAAAKLSAKGDQKRISKIESTRKSDIRDIEAMRDRIMGRAGAPKDPDAFFTKAFRGMRELNYLRLLGGMTISSLPDMARPIMVNGFKGYGRLAGQMIKDLDKLNISRNQLKKIGVGIEMITNTRSHAMGDIGDIVRPTTKLGIGMRKSSDAFGMVTLMTPWNAALKQMSGLIAQDDILEAVTRATLAKGKRAQLTKSGIDESMAKRIKSQYEKYGEKDVMHFSRMDQWDDQEAAQALSSAVLKITDELIVTPGAGDLPLLFNTEAGKSMLQFKSFAFASTNRMLLAGLQQRDAKTLAWLGSSVGLGSLTYYIKQKLSGREITDDPIELITESVDRSGVTGIMSEAYNMSSKMFGNNTSRYASRNIVDSFAGPTLGLAYDIGNVQQNLLDGELKQKDIHAVRKLMPYQNLFYTRQLLDKAEETIGDAIGAQ